MWVTHNVGSCWLVVVRCAKPGQAILVHKDMQGVTGRHQDVNPKIKLEVVYQERLMVGRVDTCMMHDVVACTYVHRC